MEAESTDSLQIHCLHHINIIYGYSSDNTKKTIQTDLSAVFHMFDNISLLLKLQHYGIREGELKLFQYFLENIPQYVEIDCISYFILLSDKCSVIQGPKLSSLLYIINTNKIPILSFFYYKGLQ